MKVRCNRRFVVCLLVVAFAAVVAACGASRDAVPDSSTTITSAPPTTAPDSTVASPSTTLIEMTSPTWFATPTRNIACVVRDGEARCDVVERTWSAPPKPDDCPFDWGPTLGLQGSSSGRFVCVSDSVFDAPDTVPWGSAVRSGSVICEVRVEGVTCWTDAGHGFSLSKESYQFF
jgi:hypothetical protein